MVRQTSWRQGLLLAVAFLLASHASALVLRATPEAANASDLSDPEDGFCHCDCCITEVQRGSSLAVLPPGTSGDGPPDRLQCAWAPPSELGSAGPTGERCGSLCQRPKTGSKDDILTAAQDPSMDTQRFCFFECEPKPLQTPTTPTNAKPQPGDPCGPLSQSEAVAVNASDGNALPPMEVPQVMSHFLLARKTSGNAAMKIHSQSKTAVTTAAASPPWLSVSKPAQETNAAVVNWAKEAEQEAATARAAFLKINEVATAAGGGLAAATKAAADAQKAAELADQAEARVKAILEGMRRKAKEAAMSAVPAVMAKMRAEYEKKAKEEAYKKAGEMDRKMKEEAPHAGDAARQPWDDAMMRAAETAADYLKAGDELAKESRELQVVAQREQTQAGQYMRLGYVKKAQELAVQARTEMNKAIALNGQANSDYGKLESITKTLDFYPDAAAAAAYRAEVMVNPNAMPPPPPLV